MRVLLVSDLHYGLPQLDWVVDASSSFDVVAVAGDSLNISSAVPLDAQSIVVRPLSGGDRVEDTLVVSSGDHDLTGPDEHGEQSALWLAELASRYPDRRGFRRGGGHARDHLPLVGRSERRSEVASQLSRCRGGLLAGCGSTTGRHWARRRAGPVGVTTATPMSESGSPSSNPMWSFAAMSHESPSKSTDPGSTGSARPGCSTPVIRSGRCHFRRARLHGEPSPMGLHHGLGVGGPGRSHAPARTVF